jgi:hypothetical protein
LIIVEAIGRARTEHVVYFLLSAWFETLEHTGHARVLPAEATGVPVRSSVDVRRRLRLVREKLASESEIAPQRARVLEDAARALHAARIKLSGLWARANHPRWERLARRRDRGAWRLVRNA